MNFDLKALVNLLVVGVSCVAKFPQILLILRTNSAKGASFISLAFELMSTSITFCYFVANAYPSFDYLEYPLFIIQNLMLQSLVIYYERLSLQRIFPAYIAYIIAVYSLCYKILPLTFLTFLTFLVIPLNSLSKLAQIRQIYNTKRGDLVSRIPWLIYGGTSAARIYTVFLETSDPLLLFQYGWSVFLNSMVILTAILYTPDEKKQKD